MTSPQELKNLIDSDPGYFRPAAADDVQPDGYVATGHLCNLLFGFDMVPNPTPAPQVGKPFTTADIMGLVSSGDRAKMLQCAAIGRVQDAIASQDRAAIANWSQLCVDDAVITSDERAAIAGILSTTVPDPKWPALIEGPIKAHAIGFDGTYDELHSLVDAALGRVA